MHTSGELVRVRDEWRPFTRRIVVLRFALIYMDTLLSFATNFDRPTVLNVFFSTAFLGTRGYELPAAAPFVTPVAYEVRFNA